MLKVRFLITCKNLYLDLKLYLFSWTFRCMLQISGASWHVLTLSVTWLCHMTGRFFGWTRKSTVSGFWWENWNFWLKMNDCSKWAQNHQFWSREAELFQQTKISKMKSRVSSTIFFSLKKHYTSVTLKSSFLWCKKVVT